MLTITPPAAGAHNRHHRLDRGQRAENVQIHDPPEYRRVDGGDHPGRGLAGVVDRYVDPAASFLDGLNHPMDGPRIPHVRRRSQRLPVPAAQFGSQLFQPRRVAGDERQLCPGLGEALGSRPPDPFRGTMIATLPATATVCAPFRSNEEREGCAYSIDRNRRASISNSYAWEVHW
jgi:hypothetical protein